MDSEYVLIGQPTTNPHAVYELRLPDHLTDISPKLFQLKDVPTINPALYFVTSGDAVCKATQLEKDLLKLFKQLSKFKPQTIKMNNSQKVKQRRNLKKYRLAIWSCAMRARSLIKKLKVARGTHCFLELEWRLHVMTLTPKDPRPRHPEP